MKKRIIVLLFCLFCNHFFSQIHISGDAQIYGEEYITTVSKFEDESANIVRKQNRKGKSKFAVVKKSSDTKVKKNIADAKNVSHVKNFKYHKLPDPDKSFGTSQSLVFSSVPTTVFKLKYLQACWIFAAHAFSYNSLEKPERFIIEVFHEADKRVFSVRPPPFIS